MHTMNFHDEVVEPDDLDLPSPQKNPSDREIEMAGKLVKSLQAHVRADTTTRTPIARRCSKLIERKRKGEEIEAPEEPPPSDDSDDLMEALEASL